MRPPEPITDVNETTLPIIVRALDEALARGLSYGVGQQDGQMCIEAAVCYAMGLPHGDDPPCVAGAVRAFKIRLNDARWGSPESRAAGLRELGIGQLGSKGVIDEQVFVQRMQVKTVRELLPLLFRLMWPDGRMEAVCVEMAGVTTTGEARAAAVKGQKAAYAAYAAYAANAANAAANAANAAAYAAYAANAAAAAANAANAAAHAAAAANAAADANAAYAAANAANAAAAAAAADAADAASKKTLNPEIFLLLSARLAYETLVELRSPGALWLDAQKGRG